MKTILTKMKSILAIMAIAVIGVTGTLLAVSPTEATGDVPIEAALKVGNATQGIHDKKSVDAKVDEVVNITAWYHNIENENSGQIAENVNVKITIPGTKTKTHQITSRVGGTNTNVVNDLATVNTSIDTNLAFIPGTATRRYNAGTNANPNWVIQSIPDSVVTTGYTVSKLNPCWNFQETINVQARVKASVLSIVKQVKTIDSTSYTTENTAEPGATLNYRIIFKNEGNTELRNVMIRDNMPPGIEYIKGSAKLYNALFPNGTNLSDAVTSGGANIGHYASGASATVRIDAKVPLKQDKAGRYTYNNIANVKADGTNEFYNSVFTHVTYDAKITEGVNIKIIKYHDKNGNKTEDSGEERLSGWKFNVTGPDGLKTSTVTDSNGIALITGDLKAGKYNVTEVLQTGWKNTTGLSIDRDVTTDKSTQTFIFGNKKIETPPTPVPPVEEIDGKGHFLPESGPAEAAAMAFGTLGLSGSAVAWVRSKKRLLDSFRK